MNGSGGGTTTVTQQAPQLLPEGKPGYEKAQTYYQGILENPPIYGGPRVAPINPAQEEYMRQSRDYFGTRQPLQVGAENEAISTTGGSYLPVASSFGSNIREPGTATFDKAQAGKVQAGRFGAGGVGSLQAPTVTGAKAEYSPYKLWEMPSEEEIQKFVGSAQQPYLRELTRSVLPQIGSDFGLAGAGINNTRELANELNAMDRTSALIASEVVAPIFNQMKTLEENFASAENERRAAIASGDADRITRASEASARIQADLETVGAELNSRLAIAQGQAETQASIAQAGYETDVSKLNTLTGADVSKFNVGAGLQRDIAAEELNQRGFGQERANMMTALGLTPELMQSEGYRQMMLRASGDYEKALNEERIAAQKAEFQEPIIAQSGAANALFGASGMGPGGASSVVNQETGAGDVISTIGQVAMMAAMIYGKCWIADAIYGKHSLDAFYARFYVNVVWQGWLADIVRNLYGRYGKYIAKKVEKYDFLKAMFRPLFDIAVEKGRKKVDALCMRIK